MSREREIREHLKKLEMGEIKTDRPIYYETRDIAYALLDIIDELREEIERMERGRAKLWRLINAVGKEATGE